MKNDILPVVKTKEDYLTVLEAASGDKTSFTEEEKAALLAIYADGAKNKFGFADQTLVKAVLALDVPGANLLDEADAGALDVLCGLYRDWEPDAEKAGAVKAAAFNADVSHPLALALARASLDAFAGQTDLIPYREDITALADILKQADKDAFEDVSVFLIRVRERVR